MFQGKKWQELIMSVPWITWTTFGTPSRRQLMESLEPADGSSSHVGRMLLWPINGCFFAIVYSIRHILFSNISHSSRHTYWRGNENRQGSDTIDHETHPVQKGNPQTVYGEQLTFLGLGSCEYSSHNGNAPKQREGIANRWHCGLTSCEVATTVKAAESLASTWSWL